MDKLAITYFFIITKNVSNRPAMLIVAIAVFTKHTTIYCDVCHYQYVSLFDTRNVATGEYLLEISTVIYIVIGLCIAVLKG